MTAQESGRPPLMRVAIDPSTATSELLRAAVHLAVSLRASLEGLLIEDETLLSLADLPFARRVTHQGRAGAASARSELERELRVRAASLRQLLTELAGQQRVELTFRIVRGPIEREILAAAAEAGLLALWRAERSIARHPRTVSRAEILPLRLLHGAHRRPGPQTTIDADSPSPIAAAAPGLLLVSCQNYAIGEKLLDDLLDLSASVIVVS